MTIDLVNLTIDSSKSELDGYFDPDREYCLINLSRQYNTVEINNLTVGNNCLDFSLLGFGMLPTNLIVNNCHVTPNFTLFSLNTFDFIGYGCNTGIDTLKIQGEVTCGSINIPDMLDLDGESNVYIRHLDIADLKFSQINQINMYNESATESFAFKVEMLTLPDVQELRTFENMLKRRYSSDIKVSYR